MSIQREEVREPVTLGTALTLDDLHLPIRARNALHQFSLAWILDRTPAELLKLKNFGWRHLGALRAALRAHGLALKGDPVPPSRATPWSDVEKLASLRIQRLSSNLDVKPIDILRAAAHDVESGAVKCTGVLVLFVDDGDEYDQSTMRAGLRWNQELTALHLELHRHTRRQFREPG